MSASVAEQFTGALGAHDLDALATLMAPDVVGWNNVERRPYDAEEMRKRWEWESTLAPGLHYDTVDLVAGEDGFAWRLRVHGTVGERDVDLDVCLVGRTADGRITRLDEYFDAGQAAALLG